MAKATDTQVKDTKKALAEGGALPKGVRINFGDPEPIQSFGASGDGPVSLNGKTKAQLEEIATAEGVDISEAATNADIVAAIESARSGE